MTMSSNPASTRHDRGFVALLLVTAGVLLLAGRAVPVLGSAVAVTLGLELLVWAVVARSAGLVVAGGLLTGVGTGVVLAAGPLTGAASSTVGATFLLCAAGGFALVAVVSWLVVRPPQHWAWVPAAAAGTIGAGLLGGPDQAAALVGWALPVTLTAVGIGVAVHWLRSR